MRRRLGSNMNIGASSLLLIFIVLSLVTFAVLSVSSALSDKRLMTDTLEGTTEYYDACNRAELRISQLLDGVDPGTVIATDEDMSAETGREYRADTYKEYYWDEPIGDDGMQVLRVVVGINHNENSYTVLSWRVVNINEPEINTGLKLL